MKVICLLMPPLSTPCTCPFLIICIASYPCNVFHAVAKDKQTQHSFGPNGVGPGANEHGRERKQPEKPTSDEPPLQRAQVQFVDHGDSRKADHGFVGEVDGPKDEEQRSHSPTDA